MKTWTSALLTVALLFAGSLTLTTLSSTPASAEEAEAGSRTLTGEYIWSSSNRGPGELKAVFTPNGPDQWQVDFHFDWRGTPRVFSGEATGSLDGGKLEGEVRNSSKQRTFTFQGKVADGVFEGTHAEIEDGYPEKTGTMTLKG